MSCHGSASWPGTWLRHASSPLEELRMSDTAIAAIVFACVFGSALLGLFLRSVLPEDHLSQDSRDVVKLGTGLIATMAALVLSLLISSAKTSFDQMQGELVQTAARVVSLDRTLADYGPKTTEIRDLLKRTYAGRVELLFGRHGSHQGTADTPERIVGTENIRAKLWGLSPGTDAQRWLQSHALDMADELASTRWLLLMQNDVSLPMPLLVALVCWLALIFATFGLLAPRNGTVVMALFVCALSTAGAIVLILEMNSPFDGFMKLSSAPMRDALAELGR
jgi:hypothetical protein